MIERDAVRRQGGAGTRQKTPTNVAASPRIGSARNSKLRTQYGAARRPQLVARRRCRAPLCPVVLVVNGVEMNQSTNRREFLAAMGITGATFAAMSATGAPLPAGQPTTAPVPAPKISHPLMIGVIGTGSRGTALSAGFAALAGAIVKYVCDVDSTHAKLAAAAVTRKQEMTPQIVDDLRRVLEDPAVDAVAIATPDHWHAPAAILALAAGKHVYVEKPCCHNPREGELLVEAVRNSRRIFQHGTQKRSMLRNIEAVARVRAGGIGTVRVSRGWYNNNRLQTGRRTPATVPTELNWDRWQGPAPHTPYTDNVAPYKWHWYWQWGTGELGNNGIHALDVCRWGLGVDYPRRVTAGGGRYYFHDAQETPDTLSVTYDFGDKSIIWEGRSCHPRGFEGLEFGIEFYGDRASLIIDTGGYRIFDPDGKLMEQQTGSSEDTPHLQNFLDCINSGTPPRAGVEDARKSTLLCHLGNIAYRTGGAIACDPATGQILDNPPAQKLWTRAYEPGWEPK